MSELAENKAQIATPASAEGGAPGSEEEEKDIDIWMDLGDKIIARQKTIGADEFLSKLRGDPAKTVRGELLNWVYQLLLQTAAAGADQADDVEELMHLLDHQQEEIERIGNLVRVIGSTSFFALVQRLVQLTFDRVQDPEILNVAQTIAIAYAPMVPAPTPVPTPQKAAVVVSTAAQPSSEGGNR